MNEVGATQAGVQSGWQPPPGGGYPPPGPPGPPGGGYPPPGPPGGGYPPPGAPPGGYPPPAPPGGGGFAPAQPPGGGKPVTGSPQTMALYATTLDPATGMPRGEKPPASTAAVVALICGFLLCLGPLTGITAIVAGFMGRKAARENPGTVGGGGMALAGIILGAVNLLLSVVWFVLFLVQEFG